MLYLLSNFEQCTIFDSLYTIFDSFTMNKKNRCHYPVAVCIYMNVSYFESLLRASDGVSPKASR